MTAAQAFTELNAWQVMAWGLAFFGVLYLAGGWGMSALTRWLQRRGEPAGRCGGPVEGGRRLQARDSVPERSTEPFQAVLPGYASVRRHASS